MVPRMMPASGLWVRDTLDGTEPIAGRLLEVPDSEARHHLRDPNIGYTTYVPPGALRRGRQLVNRGIGNGIHGCAGCHGPTLRGTPNAPPIAGQSPSYLLRQLLAFRTGARHGESAFAMAVVSASLSLEDMVAVAAYAGSRRP